MRARKLEIEVEAEVEAEPEAEVEAGVEVEVYHHRERVQSVAELKRDVQ